MASIVAIKKFIFFTQEYSVVYNFFFKYEFGECWIESVHIESVHKVILLNIGLYIDLSNQQF